MYQFDRPQSAKYLMILSFLLQLIYITMSIPWECPSDSTACLKGGKHKEFASPETSEYAACLDYKESSCCTADFTKQLAQSTVTYIKDGDTIFNWTHCGPLSAECEKYFIEIECMYRCDPNMIYFAGEYPSSLDRVPICGQYCDHWYDACQSDLACVTNWVFDWQYTEMGGNSCPDNSECLTFEQRYGDSETLCNVLWGNTFNYTQENELCLTPQYYHVNKLVTEEIFETECGLNEEAQTDDDNDGETLLILGIVFLVIGIILCIGAIIYGLKLKQKPVTDFNSVRQQSHANDTPKTDTSQPKEEEQEMTNQ